MIPLLRHHDTERVTCPKCAREQTVRRSDLEQGRGFLCSCGHRLVLASQLVADVLSRLVGAQEKSDIAVAAASDRM